MRYCTTFQVADPDCPSCCSSCHEDEDYDPRAYPLSDGDDNLRDVQVCCAVLEWLLHTPEGRAAAGSVSRC